LLRGASDFTFQGIALAASPRIFTLLVCFALVVGAAAESPLRSIDVANNGETYVVTAHVFAPVSQAIAWEVGTAIFGPFSFPYKSGGTQLVYRLELVPRGLAAVVMSEERLKRDMEEQFTAIVAEMIKRKK
jgi:hypothetical protein